MGFLEDSRKKLTLRNRTPHYNSEESRSTMHLSIAIDSVPSPISRLQQYYQSSDIASHEIYGRQSYEYQSFHQVNPLRRTVRMFECRSYPRAQRRLPQMYLLFSIFSLFTCQDDRGSKGQQS